jgi:pimeloyl-ACP methyl ester carboxylesterase
MTSTRTMAGRAFAAILGAALVVPAAHAAGATGQQPASVVQAEFARPHQLIDIGGRRLNLYCSGTGSPTVIFEAYSGGSGWAWANVQPEIARKTRACVYDRAGLSFSDPSPRPGTSANAVEDLHKLLAGAGIRPPYVMVGNSYGGINVQLYAYRYPQEVVGLVLVEAGNENETSRYDRATNGKISEIYAMFAERSKECLGNAQQGFVPGSEAQLNCTAIAPSGINRSVAAAQFALGLKPTYWEAANSENDNQRVNEAQLAAVRKPFGDLPLAVLTRGVSPYAVPGKPQSALNKALEDENKAIQDEVARLSSRGSNRVVPGASHIIQEARPDEVVRSINEVLAQVK